MGATKVMVGYGSDKRGGGKPGLYGGRTTGKMRANGGFGEPTVDFTSISDERWAEIFGTDSMPKWKRDLLENGQDID